MVDICKEYIIFSAALSEIAQKSYKAGIGHEEGEAFVKKCFNLYNESELPTPDINWLDKLPTNVLQWMKACLDGKFLSMQESPKWIGEPSWRFIDDIPMVFVDRIEFYDNAIMANNLSVGDVLYTFAGRKRVDDGWELIIKLVKQDDHSLGTTYIY